MMGEQDDYEVSDLAVETDDAFCDVIQDVENGFE